MIPYFGTPITPDPIAVTALRGAHGFVSYHRPDQIALVVSECQSFALDNGAFSLWKKGGAAPDWRGYYDFVEDWRTIPSFDFAVIPDVIDGDEEANDRLLDEWPFKDRQVGAPVWHMHEDLGRLARLASSWPRVCLGSSGAFSSPGSALWWDRMSLAMLVCCDRRGRPITKLHGLRMLRPQICEALPLASADSTNIARNVGLDSRWCSGRYLPASKSGRAAVLRDRSEATVPARSWNFRRTD